MYKNTTLYQPWDSGGPYTLQSNQKADGNIWLKWIVWYNITSTLYLLHTKVLSPCCNHIQLWPHHIYHVYILFSRIYKTTYRGYWISLFLTLEDLESDLDVDVVLWELSETASGGPLCRPGGPPSFSSMAGLTGDLGVFSRTSLVTLGDRVPFLSLALASELDDISLSWRRLSVNRTESQTVLWS